MAPSPSVELPHWDLLRRDESPVPMNIQLGWGGRSDVPGSHFQGELHCCIHMDELSLRFSSHLHVGVTGRSAETQGSLKGEGDNQGAGRVVPIPLWLLFPLPHGPSTLVSSHCHRISVRREMGKGQAVTSLSLPEALMST